MGHSRRNLSYRFTENVVKRSGCGGSDGAYHCVHGGIDSFVCIGMVGGWFWPGVCCAYWCCNSRCKRIDHFRKNGTSAHASRGDVASGGLAWCLALCVGVGHSCSTHCSHRRLCRSAVAVCGYFIWTMGCLADVRHIALDGALVAHVGGSRRHRRRTVRRIDGSRSGCTMA